MAKLPYLPLYTGDWVKDPALTLCTPATRGIWIDLLCAMHERGRCGELLGTVDQLSRFARCTAAELALALDDLHTTGAAVVQKRDAHIFVRNRRMYEESQKRKSNAVRQKRHREVCRNGPSNGEVAFESDCVTEIPKDELFFRFWEVYPRKVGKRAARGAWSKAIKAIRGETDCSVVEASDTIQKAVELFAKSEKAKGDYCPYPATWLNQGRYDDDPTQWKQTNGKPTNTQRVGPGQRCREPETDC